MPPFIPATPATPDPASAGKPGGEELGQRLLRLLSTLHVHSLSLHHRSGDVLWLSDGVFGPDEHAHVLDALDTFTLEPSRQQLEQQLDEARRAVFLAARDPLGECCGLALAIVDGRGHDDFDSQLAQTPRFAAVMRAIGALLAPPPTPTALAAAAAEAVASGQQAVPAPGPEVPRDLPPAALGGPLHARRYARLRAGGTTRRYELSFPHAARAAPDQQVLAQLLNYLEHRRERDEREPASFAMPVAAAAVLDGHFIRELQTRLSTHDLPADRLGFLLPALLWSQHTAAAQRFMDECGELGCFVALDDFRLDAGGIELLRSGALRCLKIDARLTATAMTDKYSRALLTAVVQAAHVLGLYCVAKQVESAAVAKWLASAGVEFADRSPQADSGVNSGGHDPASTETVSSHARMLPPPQAR